MVLRLESEAALKFATFTTFSFTLKGYAIQGKPITLRDSCNIGFSSEIFNVEFMSQVMDFPIKYTMSLYGY